MGRKRREVKSRSELLKPEELVRRETKAVNFLRALLFVVLIVVGAMLSFGSYKVGHKWEEDSYEREFKAIATRLTHGYLTSLTQVMWNGYVIGAAISGSSGLVDAAPNMTIPNFDQLVTGAVRTSRVGQVYWSPLIQDDAQRVEWEAYAQQELNVTEKSPQNKVCHVCGNESLGVAVPSKEVVLPIGRYACGELEWGGLSGMVPESQCKLLTDFIKVNCGCIPEEDRHHDETPNNLLSDPDQSSLKPKLNRIFETNNHDINSNITMPVTGPGPYSPIWQVYPAGFLPKVGMYDLLSDTMYRSAVAFMRRSKKVTFSRVSEYATLMFSPVYSDLGNSSSKLLGSVILDINWVTFLTASVPLGSNGIHVVLENSCGQIRTVKCNGENIDVVGYGDLHDRAFSSMVEQTTFDDFFTAQTLASPFVNGQQQGQQRQQQPQQSRMNCAYRIRVYSSEEFRSNYITTRPRLYATVVCLIFVFTSLLFITYDCYVSTRQRKVMEAALQRDEIVSSLFPAAVRERMFNAGQVAARRSHVPTFTSIFYRPRHETDQLSLNASLSSGTRLNFSLPKTEPIADFFPMVTVVFADISGFTAWSSEREPTQVFQLLETVYQAFDKIASQLGIFKIETIGDCYVAVAGLPMFQPDHATKIVKFAYECILQMHMLTHELEATLGPSTSSLSLRVGVHSGPVTAGVLRGEKSRFQLFGDTVNTTARMQTTGENNRIQVSNATAKLLEDANKSHWIQSREAPISVKGKGLIQTYWVDPHLEAVETVIDEERSSNALSQGEATGDWGDAKLTTRLLLKTTAPNKNQRLVEWNTELLFRLLKKIVASRKKSELRRYRRKGLDRRSHDGNSAVPFDEVTEIIPMNDFVDQAVKEETAHDSIDLGESVRYQLQDFITAIASMYHDNPFHNFEHASHVALSASKVVMRIVKPDVEHSQEELANRKGRLAFKRKIHESTFGISSDMLMQFAVVFSAVIHDVDHLGVSNAQLVKEAHDVAVRYSGKCVAEQNSVDIAWDLLMKEKYRQLVQCICPTDDEKQRFRQFLVNAVLATDIADKELQQKRKNRWDKAFHCGSESSSSVLSDVKIDMDRKATIVFEYIIQASDVAHTMQHWKVYTLWNERLFEERYKAYLCGREEHDPSVGWYKGEIWFFDNYIIPLAKKLETCGVFGVSSDEYLSYALENRHEWEFKGEEMVRDMLQKYGPKVDENAISPPLIEDMV